jgi:hypothetical protein
MRFFKFEAEGDTLYFIASNVDKAKEKFKDIIGDVPEYLLTVTEIDKIPDGETPL